MNTFIVKNKNNDKLIVFFLGWSFDYNTFLPLLSENYDYLFVYDYNNFNLELDLPQKYNKKYLLSWSMGVYAAYLFKDLFVDFDKKVAVNGTIFPVHDKYGIPEKIFKLTIIHAAKGLEGKFYQNVFDSEKDYNKYIENPVQRNIENRIEELKSLYNRIKSENITYVKFYDKGFVSTSDKIIPYKNQLNSHKYCNIPVEEINSGHFPFYKYQGLDYFIQ